MVGKGEGPESYCMKVVVVEVVVVVVVAVVAVTNCATLGPCSGDLLASVCGVASRQPPQPSQPPPHDQLNQTTPSDCSVRARALSIFSWLCLSHALYRDCWPKQPMS